MFVNALNILLVRVLDDIQVHCYSVWKIGCATGSIKLVQKMKRPSINDVAQKAGVSKSTVSHVINGTRYVEDETRQIVQRVIDELGYRPSLIARSLTTNRTQMIGVLVSDTSNNFFGELIRGIDLVFGTLQYGLIVCNTDEILEREEYYINLLLSQQVDGIIAAAVSQHWRALELAEMKQKPIVFVDREFENLNERPFVGSDNHAGGVAAALHMVACGHRDIGMLAGFQRLSSMRQRLEGFRQGLAAQHISMPEEWIAYSPLSVEAGKESAMHLLTLPNRPRALFVNNNFLSLGALLALQTLGLRCPEDVALVGFDDHPWAVVSNPPLTVIRQPALAIGEAAARMLLELLTAGHISQPRLLLDCDLVIRASCGFRR